MDALTALNATAPVALTPELAREIEDLLDRALVAHYTGYSRNPKTGNGVHFAPAFDAGVLASLARRGLVQVESRGEIVSPLVWLTEAGHEIIEDIIEEGAFDAHVAALRAI
jgi:hypothetical protein